MGEVLEKAVTETSQEVLDERELRPAVQPKIEITSFEEGQDLVYTINVDLMPEITPMDFSKLELTRLKATASDAEVDDALNRLAKDFRNSEPLKKARAAKEGDEAGRRVVFGVRASLIPVGVVARLSSLVGGRLRACHGISGQDVALRNDIRCRELLYHFARRGRERHGRK